MNINLKSLLFHTLMPIMISFIIAMLIPNYQEYYNSLNIIIRFKQLTFIIVWSIIYIINGISAYLIENKSINNKVLRLYYINMIFNLSYPIISFYFKSIVLASLLVIIILIITIINIISFYKVNKLSSYLLLPYLIWLIIATYIQLSVYYLN